MRIGQTLLLISDDADLSSDDLISRAAARVSGAQPESLTVSRLCPSCGSTDHGQPIVSSADAGAKTCSVSFTRSSGFEVAAAGPGSGVGVDIESISRLAEHPVDDVLLHPAERLALARLEEDDHGLARAMLWVAKEALLKLSGDGFRVAPQDVELRMSDGGASVIHAPDRILAGLDPRITFFTLSDDVVGAVAVPGASATLR